MKAAYTKDIESAALLLAKGAAVNAQHKVTGQSALIFSIEGQTGKPDVALVDLLLKSGADPNLATVPYTYSDKAGYGQRKYTPMIVAARVGGIEVIRSLIQCRCSSIKRRARHSAPVTY